MNPREEFEAVRSRIGVLDEELGRLRRRLDVLEAGWRADMPSPRMACPVSVESTAASDIAVDVAEPGPTFAVPPVLPPAEIISEREVSAQTPAQASGLHAGTDADATESKDAARLRWREWLEPLQLWPPAGEENAEVRLAAWWATRLGALLAVVGVVFLGLYVSRESQPWVRLAEVIGVTGVALGLGRWLERTLPRFGAVVVGGGLALAYFCAFAAHAVPAMQVIHRPIVALAVELAVVGAIFAAAWRRGSPVVATMAVVLGNVSAFLALRNAVTGFGPWVVLVLGIVAVTLKLARGWTAPSALGMPLAWAYLAVAAHGPGAHAAMSAGAVWVWSGLYFALFMARDWLTAHRGNELSSLDRAVQATNASLAVLVAWLAGARAGGAVLTSVYFSSGAMLLVVTAAWQGVGARALVPVFACKGAGLVALGVVAQFHGKARYLALLAQTAVMLVSAAQSRVRGLRTATLILALVAVGFFLFERREGPAALLAGATLAETIFVVGTVALVGGAGRWLQIGSAAALAGAGVAGVLAAWTTVAWSGHAWASAAAMLLAGCMAGGGLAVGAPREGGVAAAVVVLIAHGFLLRFAASVHGTFALWGNLLVLMAGGLAAGGAIRAASDGAVRRIVRRAVVPISGGTAVVVLFKAWPGAIALTATVAVAAGLVAMARRVPTWPLAGGSAPLLVLGFGLGLAENSLARTPWLAVAAVLAWIPTMWGRDPGRRFESVQTRWWRERAAVVHTLLATAITWYAVHRLLVGDARIWGLSGAALAVLGAARWRRVDAAVEGSWLLWASAGLAVGRGNTVYTGGWLAASAWIPAVVLARHHREPSDSFAPWWRGREIGVQVAIASLLGVAVAWHQPGIGELWALGGVLLLAALTWRCGVEDARWALAAAVAYLWVRALMRVAAGVGCNGASQGWGVAMATIGGVALLVAAAPFALGRGLNGRPRQVLRMTGAGAGLLLAGSLWVGQRSGLTPYATVGFGVSAGALFLAGLFARSRPHRLVGLVGLALCVLRAFFVDLDSTLHRIAAFVALGLVLLWVGFSYHRFRHLIVDREE